MTDEVRLLRRSVDPAGQGDASADKGDLGPIGADSSSGRDAPVTHARPDPVWESVRSDVIAGMARDGFDHVGGLTGIPLYDLAAPERRWESAWDDRRNWR